MDSDSSIVKMRTLTHVHYDSLIKCQHHMEYYYVLAAGGDDHDSSNGIFRVNTNNYGVVSICFNEL